MQDKESKVFWLTFWATLAATVTGLLVYDQVKDIPHSAATALRSGEVLDALASLARSLWGPVVVPRLLAVFLFAAFVAVVWEQFKAHRRAQFLLDARSRLAQAAQAAPVELPPVGNLDTAQRRLLYTLYGHYRYWHPLGEIAMEMNGTYGHAEQMIEFLEPMELVETQPNSTYGTYARLTPRGRDYCIKHGLVSIVPIRR